MGRVARAVLLTGMMGSGKTRVGERLAGRLDWPFHDTDRWVEERAGCKVAEIFAEQGEARFRELERAVLESLPAERCVIALGGGAVLSAENRKLLRERGFLVWLDASPECLAERLHNTSARPLLAGLEGTSKVERLRALREERLEAYGCAHRRVWTDGMSLDEAADALHAAVREECAA